MLEKLTISRNAIGKNELEKTNEMYFTIISTAILHKESIEKERLKFRQNPLNLIQTNKLE